MGYTHYWDRPTTIPEPQWDAFTGEADRIIRATSPAWCALAPARGDANGERTCITPHEVRTNGVGEDGHETFLVDREGRDWDFCKTARKPYDLVVVALLCALKANVKGVALRSDGDAAERAEGAAFYAEVTGRPAPAWDCDTDTEATD